MDPLSEHVNPVKEKTAVVAIADEPICAVEAPTLVSMQHEFAFFTIGVLYAAIPGLNRDLFKDFLRIAPSLSGGGAGVFTSEVKLFDGLGLRHVTGAIVDMDRTVYAVHKSMWADCRSFVGGTAFVDTKKGGTYRTVMYEIPLVDAVTLKKMGFVTAIPTVPLMVFAVNGPEKFYYLTMPEYPALPTFSKGPAKTVADLAAMEQI